jgi:chorismate synthase
MYADLAGLERTVRHLGAIDRPSASEGERQAAEWIAAALRELGLDARIEEERAHGTYWIPQGLLSAAGVAAGAIALTALRRCGILVGAHIAACAGICDRPFSHDPRPEILSLEGRDFGVLDSESGEAMQAAITEARAEGDSVGGVIELAVTGLPAGVGEPWFDTLEGVLSHVLFSVPAVKGVEFGDGFALSAMRGSEANDPFRMEEGRVVTLTNRAGGILGGISSGMPLVLRCAIKPTPSIYKPQLTVDPLRGENAELSVRGRHDPAIVHRARPVVESAVALALCDLLALRYGTDYLRGSDN